MDAADLGVLEQQLGRPPRAVRRIVVRCPYGRPAVTEQFPYDGSGLPFPTTYYLTCPHLVAAVSRLEAAGGIERWSGRAAAEPDLRTSAEQAAAVQRRLRRQLAGDLAGQDRGASLELGLAGSPNPLRLKCLHAHVAFALARPGYILGERIVGELGQLFPGDCCCTPNL